MPAYRITEVGFDNIEAIFYRTTIEMASNYDISDWHLVRDQDADVILVNLDLEECASKFIPDSAMQRDIRPILIGCSSSDKQYESFSYTLKKPITFSMIVTLLRKLEVELAAEPQSCAQHAEKLDGFNKELHSNRSLQKQMLSEVAIEPATYTFSTSPYPIKDSQEQIEKFIVFDDDSGHEPTKNAEIDGIQLDVRAMPETIDQQTVSHQSNRASGSCGVKPYNKIDCEILRFIEKRRFLGMLRKTIILEYPTEMTHHIYPPIRIYPDQQIFAYKSNFWLSPDLFSTESSDFIIQKLTKHKENVPSCDWNIRPLWLLFYLAALYGSEGRLKENSSPYDRLTLISKPDFEIVPNQLDYWKVADFMITKKSQDLNEIAEGSGVNIKTVIDFCNACEEIDIIKRTTTTHSEASPSTRVPSVYSGTPII